MTEMVSPLLQWLNANPEWAGAATFFISAAESVAIIGTIVPGSVTMTAIGTLAGAGVIPLGPTIFWAILGAIVGDGISYWMGYYFKDHIKNMWPFRTNPGVLNKGEAFVHRYGVMSVFIGRFIGPVRALVPLVAGMLGMRPLLFTVANVTSAIGWAPAYMLPGILLGAASLELPPDIAIHVIVLFFIILLFIILCFWTAYKLLVYVSFQIIQLQTHLWDRLERSKFFSPATFLLRHHDSKQAYGQLGLGLLLLVSLLCFSLLAAYIKWVGAPNILINHVTLHFFRGLTLKSPTLDHLAIIITILGQKQVVLPALMAVVIWLVAIKRYWTAWHLFLLGLLSTGSVFVIKHLMQIPRPWGLAAPLSSYSFPSGHTVLAVTLYLGIALLFVHLLNPPKRLRYYAAPFLLAVCISFSRLYLGAHWFTDVLGSWFLGTAILAFVAISYRRQPEKVIRPASILLVSLVALSITSTFYYVTHITILQKVYTPQDWQRREVPLEAWWKADGYLPTYQVSLMGFPAHYVNIQWAGELDNIKTTLLKQGWEKPPARDLISTIHRITDVSSADYLPMISWQYLDKNPVLTLTRELVPQGKMLALRLWDANRTLSGTQKPLWVGNISVVPRTYSWVFKTNRRQIPITAPLIFPQKVDLQDWEWKILPLSMPASTRTNQSSKQPVLLIREKSRATTP